MSALRFNQGKPKLAYILQFLDSIEAVARVMEFGAAKYEDGNWKKGGKSDDEYLNCMMRHLGQRLRGVKYDKDSGCSHIAMAIWNLLAYHQLNHPDEIMDEELFKERCEYWAAEKNDGEALNVEFTIRDMKPLESMRDLRHQAVALNTVIASAPESSNTCGLVATDKALSEPQDWASGHQLTDAEFNPQYWEALEPQRFVNPWTEEPWTEGSDK